ncbi:hypothetical protein [Flavobacterium terrigena]|uniref:Tetratricopeptide repeat-containing protein n=1 Tax=Flavobacterium terrigena TaxID=402734 RepID=A0A1H6QJN7_9FLAO|nr:hypothetical protein [Flavobacterium terrigena]SEI43843.1 hypothetical protein SAMN05660918_0574 [Flavobacterium terrigena]
MKKFLVFTVLLLSNFSTSFACGYSPYGEDIRYSLLKPEYFNYYNYKAFYYNASLWGFDFDYENYNRNSNFISPEANILDWYTYTSKKVSITEIEHFNYTMNVTDINKNSNNAFIKYLYQNKKYDAIAYLAIAKNCEAVNTLYNEDLWERETVNIDTKRIAFLNKLIKITNNEKNIYFKRKYAFLTIRLAHYLNRADVIENLFATQFKNGKKDYLYYWSSFFHIFCQKRSESMVDIANLMAHSPEKFYASYYYFHHDFKLNIALQQAKTKEEIANCYAYASVQKIDKNLDYLKEIYKNNPKSGILGFLLLRELNKIEDWVYTPYYTNYTPSTEFEGYYYGDNKDIITTVTLRNRSEKDRLYAQEVLNFINFVTSNSVDNPILWKAAQINLQFITRNYATCIQNCNSFIQNHKTDKCLPEIEKIKALCITANQENGKAIIKPEIQSTILKYKNDERFIFALGRELEFKGNLPDGLALISLMEGSYNEEYTNDDVEWQGNRIKTSGNLAEFYTYFDYLDFVYSAGDLQIIVNNLNKSKNSDFEKFIYADLLKNKEYLTDLLGTKYIRENQLDMALKTFKSLNKTYWENNYNPWERGLYDGYYSFEENPFYDFKYTDVFIEHKEKYIVTKLSVVEHLIKYQKLADNPATKDRDYYYFLLANCYYNMGQNGHSWMMRRVFSTYWRTSGENYSESFVDENEYRNNTKAIEYYNLAYQHAKTDKFKALCLRMSSYVDYTNTYSRKLKTEFPDFYEDLSGCENLEEYFNARR